MARTSRQLRGTPELILVGLHGFCTDLFSVSFRLAPFASDQVLAGFWQTPRFAWI
jgi:hypothetical protein